MIGSAKKFGTRYGRTLRQKYSKIESIKKAEYICPYCSYKKVKRVNTGIWQCRKCNSKFASKAYFIPKKSSKSKELEETMELLEEEKLEESEEEV